MKSKLGVIIDCLFICFALFLIEYFWILRLTKNAFLSIFCSILIYILTFIAIFKLSLKKYKLNKITLSDQKFAKKCFLSLMFCDNETQKNFLEKLLNCNKVYKNLYENDDKLFYVNLKTTCTESDFHEAYNYVVNSKNQKPLYFICSKTSNEFKQLLSDSPIKFELFSEVDLFLLMKDKNIFPSTPDNPVTKKQYAGQLKAKFSKSLTRSHFKEFFFSGLSLVVISIVIPFSLYYLIFGTFLLILSIISLFFKNSEPALSKTTLSSLIKDATKK